MLRVIIAVLAFVVAITQSMPQGGKGGTGDLYLPPKEKPGYDYPSPSNPSQPSRPSAPKTPAGDEKHEPGMPFDFEYGVNEIPTFQHKANSDGDITRGEYRVVLPDERVQVVKYTADWKNGYNAEISYE